MSDPAAALPLAFRLEKKPDVILGLTWSEAIYAVVVSGIVAIILGLITGYVISNFMFALPGLLIYGVPLFVAIGKFMQRYKHNRPNGYYQQKYYGALQVLRLGKYYLTETGYRDPRRVHGRQK